MADIGGLQLLPETRKKINVENPGENRPLVFAFLFLILVAGAYFGLLTYKNKQVAALASIDDRLVTLEKSRDKKEEAKLLNTYKQLSLANSIIQNHIFLSDAFGRIQSLIQPQVQIKSMSFDIGNGKIGVVAVASGLTTVAKQIAGLYSADFVSDIDLSKVQAQSNGQVNFSMDIFFKASKFINRAK